MNTSNRRVCKLGGSLLSLPDLAERLRDWLRRQRPAATLLIVGGGPLVDALIATAERLRTDEATLHWACIGAMRLNARLVQAALPDAVWIERLADAASMLDRPGVGLFDVEHTLRHEDQQHPDGPLPESAEVTSDSIAARVASLAGTAELVLLKSALPPRGKTWEQLSAEGYVDRYFPRTAYSVPSVRCVNLRDDAFPEMVFQPSSAKT